MQADLEVRRTTIKEKTQGIFRPTLRLAFQHFIGRPITVLLTTLVLSVLLVLPMSGFKLLTQLPNALQTWEHSPKIVLYLQADITNDKAQEVLKQLEARADIAKTAYISPEQGLKDLGQQTQVSMVDKLGNNPLPGVIEILPKGVPTGAQIEKFESDFKLLPAVQQVQFNAELMKQRDQWLEFAWQVFYWGSGLCAFIILLIMTYYLRLEFDGENYQVLLCQIVYLGIVVGVGAWFLLDVSLSELALKLTSFGFSINLH